MSRIRLALMAAAAVLLLVAGAMPALAEEAPTVEVAPMVDVMPATALTDGLNVDVHATGFPASTTLVIFECSAGAMTGLDCDASGAVAQGSDTSGALTFNYLVRRVIVTHNQGQLDCAVDACVLWVSTYPGMATFATAPIAFENVPLPPVPFQVTLAAPHFLEQGGATLRGMLHCDMTGDVELSFALSQATPSGGTTFGSSNLLVHCTPGADIPLFSDWILGFDPGSAQGSVSAAAVGLRGGDAGPITILSFEEAAALLDMNDPAVMEQLHADFHFRAQHNPSWANYFGEAMRASQVTTSQREV